MPEPEAAPPPPTTQQKPTPVDAHGFNKRKHDDGGFQNSKYFKIRAIVRDLRPLFIEVLQAPDFRNSKAVQELKKQLEVVIEVTKQLRSEEAQGGGKHTSRSQADIMAEQGPIYGKPPPAPTRSISDQLLKRAAGEKTTDASVSDQMTRRATEEKNFSSIISDQMTRRATEEKTTGASISDHMTRRATEEKSSGASISDLMTKRAAEEKITGTQDCTKVVEEESQGTYVVGGSPIGWNFILFSHSSDPVYYGVTKACFLSRQAA